MFVEIQEDVFINEIGQAIENKECAWCKEMKDGNKYDN